MHNGAWRTEVANLLEQCAEAIVTHADRKATTLLGTIIAYLEQAEQSGDRGAAALVAQINSSGGDGCTERFSYAPGELESIVEQRARGK